MKRIFHRWISPAFIGVLWLAAFSVEAASDAPAPAPAAATNTNQVYLFSFFRGNGEDGLFLAWSRDGLRWTDIKPAGKSFLRSALGDKLMRDPCLRQGPDGTFHLVWTTGWNDRIIGYARSQDLVHWTEPKAIAVMAQESTARNAWAPELFYDTDNGQFLIFWSTTIPGRFPATDLTGDGGYNHRIYYVKTGDFESFSASKLFYDGGFNVIDATLIKVGARYALVVKDETLKPVKKNLRVAWAEHAEGPYGQASEPFTTSWVEGPSAIRIGDEYVIYFDHYTNPQYYGAVKSCDFKQWEDISKTAVFPAGSRHGSALRVSETVLAPLIQ